MVAGQIAALAVGEALLLVDVGTELQAVRGTGTGTRLIHATDRAAVGSGVAFITLASSVETSAMERAVLQGTRASLEATVSTRPSRIAVADKRVNIAATVPEAVIRATLL